MTRSTHVAVTTLLACFLMGVLASAGMAKTYKIVLEAENYNSIKPAKVVKSGDTTASGGKYIEYPLKRPHAETENPNIKGDGGYALYKVNIPESGTWRIWILRHYYDGCANSEFVIVDSTPPQTIEGTTYKKWMWSKANQTYSLTKGTHTIKLQNREDGVRIDQICITNHLLWKPVKAMPETPQYKVPN